MTSSPHHALFQKPETDDWIVLLQSRLEAQDLSPDEALALAGLIHARLRKRATHKGTIYAQYARIMAGLNHQMPDTYQHVAIDWHSTWGAK